MGMELTVNPSNPMLHSLVTNIQDVTDRGSIDESEADVGISVFLCWVWIIHCRQLYR